MLVDLTDVFLKEGKSLRQQIDLDMDEFVSSLGHFPITGKSKVDLTLVNTALGKLSMEAAVKLVIRIPCDRCLKDVDTPFDLAFSGKADRNQSREDREKELDEADYLDGCHLDVDKLIHKEILLNWPMKVLCREDCRGICKKCGKNLNDGDCGCDLQELDPRMAVIKDLFKQQ